MNSAYRRAARVIGEIVDDELVLLDMDTGSYFALNGTGRRVWELLDSPAQVEAIVRDIASEFEAPEADVAKDVAGFVVQLEEAGLVQRDGAHHG